MFTLAEAEDLVIICGEFNSGVEIINESWEPEQVFSVTKIIQHPDYKPTTVGKKTLHMPKSKVITPKALRVKFKVGKSIFRTGCR